MQVRSDHDFRTLPALRPEAPAGMKHLALLLMLAGCRQPFDPPVAWSERIQPTAVTDAAAVSAQYCGMTHRLAVRRPYDSLQLFLIHGSLGDLQGHARADYAEDGRVWVLAELAEIERVWAHVFLHVIYGLPGTTPESHPKIFSDCGILTI